MDTELRIFELTIDRWEKDLIPALILEQFQQLCLEIHEGVVQKTPVDTGYARANWQVGLNVLPNGEVAVSHDPIVEGIAILMQIRLGDTVFVINGVEYINALENGHSRQAPAGMVAVTLAEVMARHAR